MATGLRRLKDAGGNAAELIELARDISSIYNTRKTRHDEINASIAGAFPGVDMGGMSDAQVNQYFFDGAGDAEAIADAQKILKTRDNLMKRLAAIVGNLPANNI